jgi:hypothetical protein
MYHENGIRPKMLLNTPNLCFDDWLSIVSTGYHDLIYQTLRLSRFTNNQYQQGFDYYFQQQMDQNSNMEFVYKTCKLFVEKGVDPSSNYNEALIVGCISGNLLLVFYI